MVMFDLMVVSDLVRERVREGASIDGRQPRARRTADEELRGGARVIPFPLRRARGVERVAEPYSEAESRRAAG
jgi:hypothetical protein